MSDNGGYISKFEELPVTSNFPLRSGKGSPYEGGTRVPLIIRWPGARSVRGTCAEPVYIGDLMPTLLEIAGLKSDDANHLDGQSLVALLQNPKARLSRDALYFHFPHYYVTTPPVSAIRAGDWKLIEYLEDNRIELYNLSGDLKESKNLATEKPDRAKELCTQLARWRADTHVQMPTPNPSFRPKR